MKMRFYTRSLALAGLVFGMAMVAGAGYADSDGRWHRSTGYQSGSGNSYGFLSGYNNTGGGNNNFYPGSGGGINTPHRSDWYNKLQAQRKWDEAQYAKMQAHGGGMACGFTTSPAYCYKLQGPYPSQLLIVRY